MTIFLFCSYHLSICILLKINLSLFTYSLRAKDIRRNFQIIIFRRGAKTKTKLGSYYGICWINNENLPLCKCKRFGRPISLGESSSARVSAVEAKPFAFCISLLRLLLSRCRSLFKLLLFDDVALLDDVIPLVVR